MKLPRDLGGYDLASLLSRYGYRVSRQTGSHLRLTSTATGSEHHVTIPAHSPLKIGTLSAVLGEVASFLGISRQQLMAELFGK